MDIAPRALRRINEIKSRRGVPKGTGLRLGFNDDGVVIKWDFSGPRSSDLVVIVQNQVLFIEGLVYMRVAEYSLDYEPGARGFYLRPRTEPSLPRSLGGRRRR